jgi:FG-GAP-like repeat/PASTA domain
MARRSTTRRGVIRAFGYVLIPGAIVGSVIGARAAIALVTVLPSFSAAQSLETGLAPVSVAIADLNGDAKPDLATANRLGGNVSVFLNLGDAYFQGRRDYGISAEPTSLAVGDVNGDRKPDLVTSNLEGTVSVLPNAGEGSFGLKRDYPTGLSSYSVAIGDLDGDRTPDLAVAIRDDDVSGSGAVSVLMNTGAGAFGAGHLYPVGADPAAVAIGDLNGDGSDDLATANTYAGTLSVLLNDGRGHFGPRRDYPTGDWAPSVAIGDLNADGKADLVAGHFGKMVSVFFNQGDGTFEVPREHETGRYPNAVAIGDLNGDGAPDLATANQSNTVSVLANWGDGSFVARRDFRTGEDPWSIAIGDLNGDGKPDLATASESSDAVSVLLNTTGLCTVPKVRAKTVPAAKRAITYGLCGLGRIRRTYSGVIAKGRVLSASPKPGSVLPTGGRVSLVVSRGRRG